MKLKSHILLLAFCAAGCSSVAAQSPDSLRRPVFGIVWAAPADAAQAARDLRAMRAMGVEAVRTSIIDDARLLSLADSLGLALYQEVPLAYVPAEALADTLAYARRRLEAALQRAEGHPSARHFGLLRYGDTSAPEACAYVRALAEHVRREGPPGSRVYYATPFAQADRCAAAVDLVLLHVLNRSRPLHVLARWRAAHPDAPASVGLGALGTWVSGGARPARAEAAHTEAVQARYLERHLGALLTPVARDTASTAPASVFVFRWWDAPPEGGAAAERRHVGAPGQRYGLHAADGTPRPALRVVEGLYTGRQRVFALAEGRAADERRPWMVLLGWGVVAALGIFYAGDPRLRRTAQRYFFARGFYRAAVQAGRDVTVSTYGVLAALLGATAVLVAGALVHVARQAGAAERLHTVPPELQAALGGALAHPPLTALAAGGLYVFGLALWAAALAAASRWHGVLWSEQTLALAVWTRWPMGLLAVAAVVVATLPAALGAMLAPYLLGGWLLIEAVATVRTLHDYHVATGVPAPYVGALALASPLALCAAAGLVAALTLRPELVWLWRVLTLS